MSIDRSLKGKSTLERHRNVLTRTERIEKLEELGQWTDDSTAIGMPKVAHRKAAVGKKDKATKTDEAVEGAEGAEAATETTETKEEKSS